MSTHSAECCPYNCFEIETSKRAPSMNAMYGRTMIRKTSLLRKIGPIARRSSFATKIIYNSLTSLILRLAAMRERRNYLEIRNEIPQIALQIPNSDRSPLYDVRYHARRCPSGQRMRIDVSRTILKGASLAG